MKRLDSRGYTLVELIVAVGLFAVIMTLASGAYFMMISLTRQAQNTATGIDNLSFALETMTRTIRTGTSYSCNGGGDCSGGASFSVRNTSGNTVNYSLSGGVILQNAVPLTDPSVVVSSLKFYASGTAPLSSGDYTQPYVTIVVSGTVSSGPGKNSQSFAVETSAAMRGSDLGTAPPPPVVTPPTNLVLTQTTRSRSFSVSWAAGYGNGGAGGCKLQFSNGSNWTNITSGANVNCDADSNSVPYDLNASGWKANWGGTHVRLVRTNDSEVMGTFSQALSCNPTSGSSSPTPTIDEDCNGYWDNMTGTTCIEYGEDYLLSVWGDASCNGTTYGGYFMGCGVSGRQSCNYCSYLYGSYWQRCDTSSCCLTYNYLYY